MLLGLGTRGVGMLDLIETLVGRTAGRHEVRGLFDRLLSKEATPRKLLPR